MSNAKATAADEAVPPARPKSKLLVTRAEAAEMLGMGLSSFQRYVQADVKVVRRGRLLLIPVAELERWVARHAV